MTFPTGGATLVLRSFREEAESNLQALLARVGRGSGAWLELRCSPPLRVRCCVRATAAGRAVR